MMTQCARMACVVGIALMLPACESGEDRLPTFPVTGKVTIDGKTPEHATVIFHPTNDTDPNAVRPRGKVAADGSFRLTSYEGNDGAPVGNYRVTVEWWLADRRSDAPPSNRLPQRFANAQKSGLTAEVVAGPNTLAPIILKR